MVMKYFDFDRIVLMIDASHKDASSSDLYNDLAYGTPPSTYQELNLSYECCIQPSLGDCHSTRPPGEHYRVVIDDYASLPARSL